MSVPKSHHLLCPLNNSPITHRDRFRPPRYYNEFIVPSGDVRCHRMHDFALGDRLIS
jgi:hypothetical protein